MLASITKIIISSFCLLFVYRINSSLNNSIGHSVSPITLWCLICWEYTVPRPIANFEFLKQGCYAQTILRIWPLFTFVFIQNHLPRPILSVTKSCSHPEIVSNSKIAVPPSFAILSSSWTFFCHCMKVSFLSLKICQLTLMG